MTTEIQSVAMTDPQLGSNNNHNNSSSSSSSNYNHCHNHSTQSHNVNNNNNNHNNHRKNNNNNDSSNNNNNNDNNGDRGEPKYLHKKFKKIAISEVVESVAAVSEVPVIGIKDDPANLSFENDSIFEGGEARKSGYVCPYCKLSCAKPSVLQKHIRAHTNERPYPCVPCGFAFKTKSNLYKHCRSRAHALKMEDGDTTKALQIPAHLSEDSDLSLSDSASNGMGTPPPSQASGPCSRAAGSSGRSRSPSPGAWSCPTPAQAAKPAPGKIYKPKFHTALQQCAASAEVATAPGSSTARPNAEQLQEHIERIISDNQAIVEALDPRLHKLLQRQQSQEKVEVSSRKRCHSQSSAEEPQTEALLEYEAEPEPEVDGDAYPFLEPLPSPGPLLGNTRLVDAADAAKRPRLGSVDGQQQQPVQRSALQMFGGEVRILDDTSGRSKTVRIEPRASGAGGAEGGAPGACLAGPETASVVVRSGLHSGGTMLHKPVGASPPAEAGCGAAPGISLAGIAPNISAPSLAPSVSCFGYLKQPASILHAGRLIPYVPGMPGPQSLAATPGHLEPVPTPARPPPLRESPDDLAVEELALPAERSRPSGVPVTKFLRPSSLPLKPGTFTPKQHHGITPTANTIALISPETPRPKKSYGQLYLNGHAYTYLGLKCSTRLFYCTLNRPQPMYVRQQHGLSMYSNWKVCKESPPTLELGHYDSRHRPAGYTLATTRQEDILTHSSQRPSTPSSPDSGLESDGQDKAKRGLLRICDGGFESNEDYTYVRGRGRGRYVCEECGIRCKKPSMLKKHIRTHTDVRPYTCKHCAFSFKTKGNLTKHMKSKAHYKKCVELKVIPVPTCVHEDNIDKEALGRLALAGGNPEDTSSSEEDSEPEAESDESDSEEQEAAQVLLKLARPRLPGLLPTARPATYPYARGPGESPIIGPVAIEESRRRLSVIHSCGPTAGSSGSGSVSSVTTVRPEESPVAPIDLRTKQSEPTDALAEVSGPALLQTIVQTMERLPVQGREWPGEPTDGHMLQAYLTERHMMDSKLKQQCRVPSGESEECTHPVKQQPPTPEIILPMEPPPPQLIHLPPQLSLQQPPPQLELRELRDPRDVSSGVPMEEVVVVPQQVPPLPPPPPLLPPQPPPVLLERLELKPNCHNLSKALKPVIHQQLPHPPQIPQPQAQLPPPQVQQQQPPVPRKLFLAGTSFRSASPHQGPQPGKPGPEFFQPSGANASNYVSMSEDSRNVCGICNKVFSKPSQLRLHINIHYFERPFRCESCGTSFRTKGHLTKHERSTLHHNKVSMTSTFGAATASNPRPFKCIDCKSAFRIHGHLAKHLRSKMHIMKLECLRKLPFGTYAEMERSGINLNDIDTTDCDTSLTSLQIMAQKLCEKDPGKLGQWELGMVPNRAASGGESSSDEGDANPAHTAFQCTEADVSRNYYVSMCSKSSDINLMDVRVDEVRNEASYKCQLCSLSLRTLNELHVHCFVEHNIETRSSLAISTSKNLEEKIKEKENTHYFKRVNKCTTREAGQRVDAT